MVEYFSDQCKEREENNRMGKTRDLFKKIRDAKETFHAKMGLIKDRNVWKLSQRGEFTCPKSGKNKWKRSGFEPVCQGLNKSTFFHGYCLWYYMKGRIDKLDFIKFKNLHSVKDNIKIIRR